MPALLTIDSLSAATPDGTRLFHDLTLALGAERVGLVGRNGSGKSTLLRIVAGDAMPASGRVALLAVASFVAVWAIHGFRYTPSESPSWQWHLEQAPLARTVPLIASVTGWIDGHRLLPNAFTEGFLIFAQSMLPPNHAYLAGEHSEEGWWYYFVVAFLIKTPIALITLTVIGAVVLVRRRQEHLRLDVDERRGHHEELAREVDVELLHQLERLEILARELGDGNVVDVDLVLADEVQEEIHRPVEDGQPHVVARLDGSIVILRGADVQLGSAHSSFAAGSLTAARTSVMVTAVTSRAWRAPSRKMSRTSSGRFS